MYIIQLPEPIAGKKIVAAMNSSARKLEGVDFIYTPHQVFYAGKAPQKEWFYERLELVVSSISLDVLLDDLKRVEAEDEYSVVSFSPKDGQADLHSKEVYDILEKFSTLFQSELERPVSEIAHKPRVKSMKRRPVLPELSNRDRNRIDRGEIRILAIVQGEYGRRIAENIKRNGPRDWEVKTVEIEKGLPPLIDDPEEYLPSNIPKVDLLLAMQEEPSAAQLIVDIVLVAEARAVIAPIDNSEWLPEGMMNQIRRELKDMGVASVFPRPFCILEETGDVLIDVFVEHFGKPELELKWEDGKVTRVDVKRDAACGSAGYVAKELVGVSVEDAVEKAGLAHHHYPCLASMKVEKDLQDTLMHVSGLQIKKAVEKSLEPERKKKVVYIDPDML